MHVLPKGFVHIRHYGFLANNCKRDSIKLCRELIGEKEIINDDKCAEVVNIDNIKFKNCPVCQSGFLSLLSEFQKKQYGFENRVSIFRNIDTS